jgi:hypothetical protein
MTFLMYRRRNEEQEHLTKTADKYFEYVEKLKYFATTATN